jgi:hypothetical protein
MSLGDNITRVHRPAMYTPTVYIAWREELWQRGDPMFYSVRDRRQMRTAPAGQPASNPPGGGFGDASERRNEQNPSASDRKERGVP